MSQRKQTGYWPGWAFALVLSVTPADVLQAQNAAYKNNDPGTGGNTSETLPVFSPTCRLENGSPARLENTALSPELVAETLSRQDVWNPGTSANAVTHLHELILSRLRSAEHQQEREAYIRWNEPRAKSALTAARRQRDFPALMSVALTYRLTPSGREAAHDCFYSFYDSGNMQAAALIAKGLVKDSAQECDSEEVKKLWLEALDAYSLAGLDTDATQTAAKLRACNSLTDEEKQRVRAAEQQPVRTWHIPRFSELWREREATPDSPEQPISIVLRQVLAFGADAAEASDLLQSPPDILPLCLLLDPPVRIAEVSPELLDSWSRRFPLSTKAGLPAVLHDYLEGKGSPQIEAMLALRKIGRLAVPSLIAAFKTPGDTIQFRIASVLGEIGPPALPYLVEALKDNDPLIKAGAASAIAGMAPLAPRAIKQLVHNLEDKNEIVSSAAANALVAFGSSAVPALVNAAKNPNRSHRYLPMHILARMGPKARAAIPTFIEHLNAPETSLVSEAITGLFHQGAASASAVPALLEILQNKTAANRRNAIRTLGSIGKQAQSAIPALVDILSSNEDELHLDAAAALGNIGEQADSVIPALRPKLNSSDRFLPVEAALAILKFKNEAHKELPLILPVIQTNMEDRRLWVAVPRLGKSAVPELARILRSDTLKNRILAGSLLLEFGPDCEPVLPELISYLQDDSPEIRRIAIMVIGRIGPAANEAVDHLIVRLSDKNPSVVSYAINSLGEIGGASAPAVPHLMLHFEGTARTREQVLNTLGQIGAPADEAVPKLISIFLQPEITGRRGALDALIRMGPKAAAAITPLLTYTSDEEVRADAARALSMMDSEFAVVALPELIQASSDTSLMVRLNAIQALGNLGAKADSAIPRLLSYLQNEPDYIVRAATIALGQIGTQREIIAHAVFPLTNSGDVLLRSNAFCALAQMGGGPVIAKLNAAFQIANPPTRAEIVRGLRCGGADSLSFLLMASMDFDKEVRDAAAFSLSIVKRRGRAKISKRLQDFLPK